MKPAVFDYYLDFFTIPVACAMAAYFFGLSAVGIFGGLILFTFVEYWTHRLFLHVFFWSAFHQRHHQHAAEYVIFPIWYTPAILAGAWLILPGPWVVGWTLGMIWFYAWHHVLHHWNLRPKPPRTYPSLLLQGAMVHDTYPVTNFVRYCLRAYAEWHELHHKDLPCNYGITTPFWDLMFGSYLTRQEGRDRLMERTRFRRPNRKPAPPGMRD